MPKGNLVIVNNTAYSGEVVEKLLVRATTGNEIVDGGYVHVHPGIKSKLTLPRTRTKGKFLQRRKAMPTSGSAGDSKGKFEYSEKYLEPQDMMAYTEFLPSIFEHIWRPFQPTGEMVFQELPHHVQETLLSELAKVIDMELGDLYINCKKGAGDYDFFNGILAQMIGDTELTPVAGAHEITEETILPVMRKIRKKIPKHLRRHKDLTWFMSTEDFDTYDDVITEKPFKGADYRNMSEDKYKNIRIAVLSDLPKDVMFVTVANPDMDSNLWIGVNLSEDTNAIQIGKVANNGEMFFFKMLMKADTNTVYGEDIVLWDGRGVAAPAGAPLGDEPDSLRVAAFGMPEDQTDKGSAEALATIAEVFKEIVAWQKEKDTELIQAIREIVTVPNSEKAGEEPSDAKLTKAAIRKLKRDNLVAFIEDNKLEIEIPEGTTNAQLAEKIIDALGEDYFTETEAGE